MKWEEWNQTIKNVGDANQKKFTWQAFFRINFSKRSGLDVLEMNMVKWGCDLVSYFLYMQVKEDIWKLN